MNELTNEELIMRIAKTKASGLTATAYFKLMGFCKNHVYSARKQLHNRGVTDEHINSDVSNRIDTLRSWMDMSPIERGDFADLYALYLERPKGMSDHEFVSEYGIDEYEFKRLRTGYKYFTDIFEKLSSKDAAATVNSGIDGPIRIVYTGDKKEEDKEDLANDQFTNMGLPSGTDLEDCKPGTYIPVEYDEEEQAYCKTDEPVSETPTPTSETMWIDFTRYDGDDVDRCASISVPFDIDHVHEIFESMAQLIFAFMTTR